MSIQKKPEVEERFVEVFNTCLGHLGVSDEGLVPGGDPLERIPVTTKSSSQDPMVVTIRQPWPDTKVAVHWDRWNRLHPDEQLAQLVHTACHLVDLNHTDKYWDALVPAARVADRQFAETERFLRDTARLIIRWVRSESQQEALIRELPYDIECARVYTEEIDIFLGRWNRDELWMKSSRLDWKHHTDRQLLEAKQQMSQCSEGYIIPPIQGEPMPSGVEITTGDIYAQLLAASGRTEIPIIL